jgi:hypothetical protein
MSLYLIPESNYPKQSVLSSIPTLWDTVGDISLQSLRTTFRIGLKDMHLNDEEN